MNSLPIDEAEVVSPPPYTLVATPECFNDMLEHLKSVQRLAVDIEADSLYHYFEKVCLIQISSDRFTYILDPLAVDRIGELAPLMNNRLVEKVFHAAGYDIFCLRRDYGFEFAGIFDTHVAAQLLGYEFLGLSTLMGQLLGVHHSKRRQRDDWSRRPLASGQLEYAAMDTHHLLRLRDVLEADLRVKGRLSWAQEEFDAATAIERPEKEFDAEGFRRIKGNRELAPQDQLALRALYVFRDEIARKMDVPPFKVMNNSTLMELVRRPPLSPEEMFSRRGISNRVARKHASSIMNIMDKARQQDPSVLEPPSRNNWKAPGRAARLRLEALKIWRNEKAQALSLPVGVVFPAYLLETLAITPPADLNSFARLPGMRQWRIREFGEELIRLLQSQESQVASTDEP
ncbi:MAG: HRDC domain-containing protein [Acidobacteria bacterium]|nr:HRDC domain-containing protein [Acidobacteriota bacterium]